MTGKSSILEEMTVSANDPVTAYMDMEFGGICGTWQRIKLPVEAGVLVHYPDSDGLEFSFRKFSYDIDITIWKNITDDLGRTIGKNPCSINPAKNEMEPGHVKKIRLNPEERKNAYRISRTVHIELKDFMRSINGSRIGTLVFFGSGYEKTALAEAQVNLTDFIVNDLQSDIKSAFGLKEVLSLDRLSHIIRFNVCDGHMSSLHFRYFVPELYRDLMNPHDSLGDAARIFLASQECKYHRDELGIKINEYLTLCGNHEKTGTKSERTSRDGLKDSV